MIPAAFLCPPSFLFRKGAGFFYLAARAKKFFVRGGSKVLSNLKAALAARRMRQVDLAMELKIAPSVLSEIVNGRRELSPSLRARIAEILNADAGWLFQEVHFIPGPKSVETAEPRTGVACAAREL